MTITKRSTIMILTLALCFLALADVVSAEEKSTTASAAE